MLGATTYHKFEMSAFKYFTKIGGSTHGNLILLCASTNHLWQAAHRQYKFNIDGG